MNSIHVSQFDSKHFGGEQCSLSPCGQHSTDYLTIHFVSSKIFMFADIQMQLLKKHTQNPNGAVWVSQLPSVFALGCTSVMLFLSQLSPVALVTDQNQNIPAVPAAGLTQAPSSGEGNAALRHQCSSSPLGKQICSSNNCLYPHIQLELTKPNLADK